MDVVDLQPLSLLERQVFARALVVIEQCDEDRSLRYVLALLSSVRVAVPLHPSVSAAPQAVVPGPRRARGGRYLGFLGDTVLVVCRGFGGTLLAAHAPHSCLLSLLMASMATLESGTGRVPYHSLRRRLWNADVEGHHTVDAQPPMNYTITVGSNQSRSVAGAWDTGVVASSSSLDICLGSCNARFDSSPANASYSRFHIHILVDKLLANSY